MLRDYLCSRKQNGPWVAHWADGYEQAATQFARCEDLREGDIVYVGIPAPLPEVFTGEGLAQHIAERLGIPVSPELEKVASGLAGEANYRMDKFATDQAAELGRAMKVRPVRVGAHMTAPKFAIA